MSGPEGWGQVAELRQGLYRFLAGSLLAPDADRMAAVVGAAEVLAGMGIDDFAFAGAWHRLEDEVAELPELDQVEAAYVRLFVAGAAGPRCPATESTYVSTSAGCGAGDVHAALRRAYAELGFEVQPGGHYPIDHVAAELEAMASLCHEEAHAWEAEAVTEAVAALRREWTFLDRHPAAWLPSFAARMAATGERGFYPAVVTAADAFVRHDHQLVTSLTRARMAGLPA